ncbi:hypothetical protein GCM10007148_17280 [Parvularcula lutaonensis]|nr:hypothetical protein GCM10007148_17280 [Parvularcula lutaonensis]
MGGGGRDSRGRRLRNKGDDPVKGLVFKRAAQGGRKAFWAWIAYQSIKGTLTLSLVWVPLLIAWWKA